ncbi:hypothetical protein GCM10009116_10740 [Brevundimonas basaltis]
MKKRRNRSATLSPLGHNAWPAGHNQPIRLICDAFVMAALGEALLAGRSVAALPAAAPKENKK